MSEITNSEVSVNEEGAPVFKLQPVTESTKQSQLDRTATEDQVLLIKQELDKEIEGLEKHQFLIRMDDAAVENLLDFLRTKIKWKFKNSYGVVQCYDTVIKAQKESKKFKTDGIYLDNVVVQAIAYFLSLHEDVGLDYAKTFISIIDPLFETIEEATKWRKRIELLEKKYIIYSNSFEEQIPIEESNLEFFKNQDQENQENNN